MASSAAILGIRVHSGWGALVGVSGTIVATRVLFHRRITLIEGRIPAQPFHTVENAGVERARKLLAEWRSKVGELAVEEIRSAIAAASNHRVAAIALLMGSGRQLPPLERILAAHPLIHTAEGEFYREAIADAAERLRLPLVRVVEKQVMANAEKAFRLSADELQHRLTGLRAQAGPPWTQDQKLATLAALLALKGPARK